MSYYESDPVFEAFKFAADEARRAKAQREEDEEVLRRLQQEREVILNTDPYHRLLFLLRVLDDERKRQYMTKADLSRRSQISDSIVRKLFFSAVAPPSYLTLFKIADALGFDIVLQKRNK